jgi:hypothetical protein
LIPLASFSKYQTSSKKRTWKILPKPKHNWFWKCLMKMIFELFDEKQFRRTLNYLALIWTKHCRAIGPPKKRLPKDVA